MKEVISIIRPEKWDATREAVAAHEVYETVHVRVLGRGHQRGLHYLRRMAAEKEESKRRVTRGNGIPA